MIGTTKPKGSQPRERVLADAELAAIWRACGDDDYGRMYQAANPHRRARHEIGGMAWSEMYFEQGTWTLPGSRSKNKKAHVLPLLPAMLAVIKDVPRMAGRDLLFGARARRASPTGRATRRGSISARV